MKVIEQLQFSFKPGFILLVVTVCVFVIFAGNKQNSNAVGSDEANTRRKITKIIQDTIRQGEGVVNGVNVWTKTPPSSEAIQEARRLGDHAIPVLASYIGSKSERERALAVEFLGNLGGMRIVEPLRTFIQRDKSPMVRMSALRWITQAPWDLAGPIMKTAEADPSTQVRQIARTLLAERGEQ